MGCDDVYLSDSKHGQFADSSEHCNEPSGSAKVQNLLNDSETISFSKKFTLGIS